MSIALSLEWQQCEIGVVMTDVICVEIVIVAIESLCVSVRIVSMEFRIDI